ncbi:RING [Musa troglodytarum]|uniref:RING n=1 Tax=Musa troglodytarum TaxID=320322 RepID=A0A9E7I484_9LILI|nr:RING [Musa troglodytarum]
MDVFARSSSFSSSSPSSSGRRGSQSRGHRGTASKIIERVICATLTCVFAAGCWFAGRGGHRSSHRPGHRERLAAGAGIGAISGAVFCIEAVESSLDLWNSRESGIWSLLYVIDIICSLLSGRIIREKVDPAMQSAVQSQMSAADLPSIENSDLFATDSTGGLPADAVEKLPKTNITAESLEAAGESLCCSVCLQDFQVGETARRLPHCQHTFHLPCIDAWLVRHGSCPLCRRDVDVPFAL